MKRRKTPDQLCGLACWYCGETNRTMIPVVVDGYPVTDDPESWLYAHRDCIEADELAYETGDDAD